MISRTYFFFPKFNSIQISTCLRSSKELFFMQADTHSLGSLALLTLHFQSSGNLFINLLISQSVCFIGAIRFFKDTLFVRNTPSMERTFCSQFALAKNMAVITEKKSNLIVTVNVYWLHNGNKIYSSM